MSRSRGALLTSLLCMHIYIYIYFLHANAQARLDGRVVLLGLRLCRSMAFDDLAGMRVCVSSE